MPRHRAPGQRHGSADGRPPVGDGRIWRAASGRAVYDIDHNPDEFVGLPGAFAALGAAGVLSTLWPVSDDATALLMAKFYELHREAALAPPTALARAQAWLREGSNEALTEYARVAARQDRIKHRHLADKRFAVINHREHRLAHGLRTPNALVSGHPSECARYQLHG